MKRFSLLILMMFSMNLLVGCGGSETPKGKALEDLQTKSQQKADDEEREYQKSQQKKK